MPKIILASASPQRIKLLRKIVSDFEIQPADVDETLDLTKSAAENVKILARKKALAAQKNDEEIVIGGDTLGEFEGRIFGKPRNKFEAVEWLKSYRGKFQTVASGVVVCRGEEIFVGVASAKVFFRAEVADAEIEKYVVENPVEHFAGGYAIQAGADAFVERINGDVETIVGFPTKLVVELLENFE